MISSLSALCKKVVGSLRSSHLPLLHVCMPALPGSWTNLCTTPAKSLLQTPFAALCSWNQLWCLVNSLLVEAQNLTVNMEGIEKELKAHHMLEGARQQQKWSWPSQHFSSGEPSVGYASEKGVGKPGLPECYAKKKPKPNLEIIFFN